MKAVVIGGTGHIGTYLVPMLVDAGFHTICVTRGKSEPYEYDPAWEQAERLVLDRSTDPNFAAHIAALDADVVIDLVAFEPAEVEAMVAALSGTRLSHYLYCSSCWAHGRAEVLPLNPDNSLKEPLCDYGRKKFATDQYLKERYLQEGFPATSIMPGQISGPGWTIMNPWANKTVRPFQLIANGEEIMLPNFGMETLHHVHGYDVAQCFFKAVVHRNAALGESFDAVSGQSITLYGYAKLMYRFFGKEPQIGFLPWPEWCDYVGDPAECEDTYLHIARSGFFSLEKERRLLEYEPRYSNVDVIKAAVQSYMDRGLVIAR